MIVLSNQYYDFDKVKPYLEDSNYSLEKEILDYPQEKVWVFPTRRFGRYILKKYVESSRELFNTISVPELKIYSLIDLAKAIISRDYSDYVQVDELSRHLLISDIIESLRGENELEYFNVSNTHTLSNVAKTIGDLRDNGVTAASFSNAVKEQEPTTLRQRLNDLSRILSEYEDRINHNNFSWEDEPSILSKATQNTPEEASLFSHKEVVISGFSKFNNFELDFVKSLLDSRIPIRIDFNANSQNPRLFGSVLRTIDNLKNDSLKLWEKATNTGSIAHVYFTGDKCKSQTGNTKYVSIARKDKLHEVETLARLIKYLVYKEKAQLNDMLIASSRASDYSHYVREIFSLQSIPSNITDRFLLSESSLVSSIIFFIESILGGLTRQDIASIKKNNYLDIPEFKDINLYDLQEALGFFKVFSIRGWKNKSIKDTVSPQDNNLIDKIIKKEYYKKYSMIMDRLEKLYDKYRVSETCTHKDLANTIKSFIHECGIADKILQDLGTHINTAEGTDELLRHEMEKDSRALNTLLDLLDRFAKDETSVEKDKAYNTKDLLAKLKIAISLTRFQIKELPNYGVDVTSIEQARELPYKYVFLLGMAEGITPSAGRSVEPGLKELFRSSNLQQYEYEKHLFYQLITKADTNAFERSTQFYFFYPENLGDQRSLQSHFVKELEKNLDSDATDYTHYCSEAPKKEDKNYNQRVAESDLAQVFYSSNSRVKFDTQAQLKYSSLSHPLLDKLQIMLQAYHTATKLEKYHKCAYKYLFEEVIGLKEERDSNETQFIEKKDIGTYYHLILELFHQYVQYEMGHTSSIQYKDKDFELLNLRRESKEEYLKLIERITTDVYNAIPNLQFRDYEISSSLPLMRKMVEIMIDSPDYKPYKSEYRFEVELNENLIRKSSDKTYKGQKFVLKGSIDRLDIMLGSDNRADDEEEHPISLGVIDYKTSDQTPTARSISTNVNKAKETFQLPLYSLAASMEIDSQLINLTRDFSYLIMRKDMSDKEPYLVKDDSRLPYKEKKNNNLTISQIISASLDQAFEIHEKISNAEFIRDDFQSCQYCPYPELCKKKKPKKYY